MRGKNFYNVENFNPRKSAFDLSYTKLFTADMGKLYPIMCDEMVPGDIFKIGNEAVVRMMPLVSPVLHEINIFVHYFFVPYRILSTDLFSWEDFITGGEDGDDASVLPRWEPTDTAVGSLWDYFGFPPGVDPDGAYPMDFPRRSYAKIWNEYYRDETNQDEVDEDTSEVLLSRCWEKDYFTSALPFQQRGTAPSLPISGTTSAVFNGANFLATVTSGSTGVTTSQTASTPEIANGSASSAARDNLLAVFNDNTVDLGVASTFDIADLRLAFQIQKWMERNARCGVRYTEFLQGHFGVSPRDERLQRPEYIGGSKSPIIVSEVLQTSQTDPAGTPQGTLAGHGISVNSQFAGSYHAKEFGLVIGLMSIMPRTMYTQGINRQWLRTDKFDFPFPEFTNLSEQAIMRAEIFASNTDTENLDTWGYQGYLDEMRFKPNQVCGLMRTDFDYWHLGRIFASAPALNSSFLTCNPDTRIFAVESEPGFVVHFANLIKAIRPIPIMSTPGLIDHN